jgi:hypothetical protein
MVAVMDKCTTRSVSVWCPIGDLWMEADGGEVDGEARRLRSTRLIFEDAEGREPARIQEHWPG